VGRVGCAGAGRVARVGIRPVVMCGAIGAPAGTATGSCGACGVAECTVAPAGTRPGTAGSLSHPV
jgi:hypothetical protein